MSKAAATASGQQWYRTLNATQWKTLLASNLGWVFDGFETFALMAGWGLLLATIAEIIWRSLRFGRHRTPTSCSKVA
jgi:hypothetical protein